MTLIAEPPHRHLTAVDDAPATTSRRAGLRSTAALAGLIVRNRLVTDRESHRRRDMQFRRLWVDAARRLDLPTRRVGASGLEIAVGGGLVEVHRAANSLDTPEVLDRAGDKALVHTILAAHGVPVPEHRTFTLATMSRARAFLDEVGGPCVVKPAQDTSAGRGVTTNVRDARGLRAAVADAAAAGALAGRGSRRGSGLARLRAKLAELQTVPLLIERQVPGENYRLLYLDGVLVDAVQRLAPTVVADGRSTVSQIIDRVNAHRLATAEERGEAVLPRDPDLAATLRTQDLTLASVPPVGTVVRLKTTINSNAREDNRPATHLLHPAVVEAGAVAARALGTRLVGVDVITTDPGQRLDRTGGCVLELNTTPGLAFHYHGHPGGVDAALVVLARLAHA